MAERWSWRKWLTLFWLGCAGILALIVVSVATGLFHFGVISCFPVRQVAESAGLMKRAVLALLLVVLTAVPARGVLRLPDVEPFSVAEGDGAWDKVLATHHHLNQPHHHFYSF